MHKSVLWRVAECLSYILDARYLKVKSRYIHGTNQSTHCEPSGIPNMHSHTVKNFMVLSLA